MKDLNDEGEKMGEGNWNESDLGSGRQKKMVCKRNLSCRMRFRVRNKSENLPPRGAPCLQCPRLGAGIFSVMTVLVSILLEVAGNVWADGGVISTF